MINKMSDITRLIDRLILKDYVLRKTHSSDKRLVDIIISSKGKVLLSNIRDHNLPLSSILGNLNNEESEQLNLTLDKLRKES